MRQHPCLLRSISRMNTGLVPVRPTPRSDTLVESGNLRGETTSDGRTRFTRIDDGVLLLELSAQTVPNGATGGSATWDFSASLVRHRPSVCIAFVALAGVLGVLGASPSSRLRNWCAAKSPLLCLRVLCMLVLMMAWRCRGRTSCMEWVRTALATPRAAISAGSQQRVWTSGTKISTLRRQCHRFRSFGASASVQRSPWRCLSSQEGGSTNAAPFLIAPGYVGLLFNSPSYGGINLTDRTVTCFTAPDAATGGQGEIRKQLDFLVVTSKKGAGTHASCSRPQSRALDTVHPTALWWPHCAPAQRVRLYLSCRRRVGLGQPEL